MLITAIGFLVVGFFFLMGFETFEGILRLVSMFSVQKSTTVFSLIVFVAINIALITLYKMAVKAGRLRSVNKRKIRKVERNLRGWISFVHVISVMEIICIFLNNLLIRAKDNYCMFLVKNEIMLMILKYVGGILIATSIGLFIANHYLQKYKEMQEQLIWEEETDDYPPDKEYQ